MHRSIRSKIGATFLISITCLILSLVLAGYWGGQKANTRKVEIVKRDGKYVVLRDGRPYFIKGASGDTHFSQLRACGGNTMRVWDTTNLGRILDSAYANQITVIAGLPIPNTNFMEAYKDRSKAAWRYEAFQTVIRKYKNHPALLMWCLGNELNFPSGFQYQAFYRGFNALTRMIRHEDPDHPITTTVSNFNQKLIFNINLRCDVDVISFNIFGNISSLGRDLYAARWYWNGPYMLLEWGIDGPWEGYAQTAWGAFIEAPSHKKAQNYLKRYIQNIPHQDPRFLGSFVFFWGHKQETTDTWFSFFDEKGASSESVAVMQQIWTGKSGGREFPGISKMLLDNKLSAQNIILNSGDKYEAETELSRHRGNIKMIKWEIFREDWYRENQENSTKALRPLNQLITSGNQQSVKFSCPSEEGPYRLFASVYDYEGNFSTANIPFYVASAD